MLLFTKKKLKYVWCSFLIAVYDFQSQLFHTLINPCPVFSMSHQSTHKPMDHLSHTPMYKSANCSNHQPSEVAQLVER